MSFLKVENLVVSFRTPFGHIRAVDGVSFELSKGETIGFVGESGSGKTVTALSLLRLIQQPAGRIESGRIIFDGIDLTKASDNEMRKIRGKRISMIFQEPMTSLNPVFTVGDQIMEPLKLHQGLNDKQARDRCMELMDLVGIPDSKERIDYYPHQMSGGLRQRVMIAMALGCNPEILIADEPTTALDVTIQAQILNLIRDLQKKLNMAMILITHDFGVIAETCKNVAVMYAGRIVEKSDVRSIFKSPSHPYTAALQKCIPALAQHGQDLHTIPGIVPSLTNLPPGCRFSDRCSYKQNDCTQKDPTLLELSANHLRSVACYHPLSAGG